jgi:hypothetical protein
MAQDPVEANPEHYWVVFENDRVRVLEYTDAPGDKTAVHGHPDSVMITASAFRRRISSHDRDVDVELPAGAVRWVPAQEHSGQNTGHTKTHSFFVELKEPAPNDSGEPTDPLGPTRA